MAVRFLLKPGLVWLLLAALFGLAPLSALLAEPVFNDPGFASTWDRVDKPVETLAGGVGRGYTWGPLIPQAAGVTKESYNGGQRTVQYFDKARMEVNNPNGNPQDLYYVTTGLLVKELVTGKRQDGDNSFTQLPPSIVQVAGDSNENGSNSIAPTYASFQNVGTFGGSANDQPFKKGQPIGAHIDRTGSISFGATPEQRLVAGYDEVTKHNIPDVFVTFANAEGPIWNGSATANGKVFFGNPTYVLGRPLTEAYWTSAVVRGVTQAVMVQLFERRVLTYTPSNPDPYKVEMGNVGQHYYRWRYSSQPQPNLSKVWEAGKDINGMLMPWQVGVDGQGNIFVLIRNGIQKYDASGKFITGWARPDFSAGQMVVDSQGNVYWIRADSTEVDKWDSNGHPLPPVGGQGIVFDGIRGLGIDRQDNLYVLTFSQAPKNTWVFWKFDSTGKLVSNIEIQDKFVQSINFNNSSIAVDSQGNLYIYGKTNSSDTAIFKLDSTGNYLGRLDKPNFTLLAMKIDSNDNFFITDGAQITKLDKNFKTLASFSEKELPAGARLYISGLAVDRQGNVYATDANFNWVQKFDNQGNYLSKFGSYATGPGQLRAPLGVAVDSQDNVYVANSGRARIDKYDQNGQFLLEFGSRGKGNGQFTFPVSLAVDSGDNIYVADLTTGRIQKFDKNGTFLQNWGSIAVQENVDELPVLGIDGQDNLYVLHNAADKTIQRFNNQGQLLNSIGNSGSGQDLINNIRGFAVGRVAGQPGKVYILNEGLGVQGLQLVIKVYDSDGKLLDNLVVPKDPVGFYEPSTFAVDLSGNFYLSDFNGRISKFNAQAVLIASWGPETYSPEVLPFIQPFNRCMVIDSQNNILAADTLNDWLLKLRQS